MNPVVRASPGPALAAALAAWTVAMLLACGIDTDATPGERTPGGSTGVEPAPQAVFRDDAGALRVVGRDGATVAVFDDAGAFNPAAAALSAIAVDERDETAYVAQSFPTHADGKRLDGGTAPAELGVKTLYAVRAGATDAVAIMRLDGDDDTRVLFPIDGVLLATHHPIPGWGCETRLARWSIGAASFPRTRLASTCITADALSPSRRIVSSFYSDNEHLRALGLLDPSTLAFAALDGISADGEVEGAAWLHQRDGLVTVSVHAGTYQVDLWDLSGVSTARFASPPITTPRESTARFGIDTGAQARPVALRISPDDRLAVLSATYGSNGLSLAPRPPPVPSLQLVDLRTGALRTVDGVVGPVGFTPDDSTLVAWRSTADAGVSASLPDGGGARSGAALVFIDRETLARTEASLPFAGPLLLFVTRTGHRVIVSALGAPGELLLFDSQMGRVTGEARSAPALNNFVTREDGRDLWIAHDGLWRISLLDDSVERVALGWNPEQINLLPRSDLLVLDRPFENALSFWSPTTRTLQRTVRLPVPVR